MKAASLSRFSVRSSRLWYSPLWTSRPFDRNSTSLLCSLPSASSQAVRKRISGRRKGARSEQNRPSSEKNSPLSRDAAETVGGSDRTRFSSGEKTAPLAVIQPTQNTADSISAEKTRHSSVSHCPPTTLFLFSKAPFLFAFFINSPCLDNVAGRRGRRPLQTLINIRRVAER